VLAGGQSSRMGRDKAQLPFRDTTLLKHALGTLRSAGFTPAVAGLRGDETLISPCVAPCIPDTFVDAGPLGGIEAALRSLSDQPPQPVLFVPVDLPLLPKEFLEILFERAAHSGAWATIPFATGRPQPLCAVYDSSLAGGIAKALANGDRKVMRVLRKLAPGQHFDSMRVEALVPLHHWKDAHRWFTNLNTPADWEALASATAEQKHLVSTEAQ